MDPDTKNTPGEFSIDRTNVEILVRSIISAHQEDMIRNGRLERSFWIHSILGSCDNEKIEITTETLGLDSLDAISLAMRLSRFFDLGHSGVDDYLLAKRNISSWVDVIASVIGGVGGRAQFTFSTSGSLGAEKHVSHSITNLLSETYSIHQSILKPRTEGARIISLVPPHHIYGFLWGVLLSTRCESKLIQLQPGSVHFALSEAKEGDIVLATPNIWEAAAGFGFRALPGVVGVSSGGPTSMSTWSGAQVLGLEDFVDVYGSTETGGIGWRRRSSDPYNLFSDISVREGDLFRGIEAKTRLDVQDHLEWQDDRKFKIFGRKDDVVQVGGANVSLHFVRDRIAAISGVADVAVRHGSGRLKAFVVPASNSTDESELNLHIRRGLKDLPATARPYEICFGTELPKNDLGKLRDW